MTSILIGNLTWWTSEDDIRSALDPEDPIDIEIFTKKSNGKSKGYARLTFIDESAKVRAKLVFGRTLILSRVLEVVEDSAENVGKFESRFGPETDSETSNELDCLGVYDEPKVFRRRILTPVPRKQNPAEKRLDPESEMIVARNEVLTSNAIRRAFVDLIDKNFDWSFEALDVAAQMIGVCRVADDERCKAMIRSLKDFGVSIESEIAKSRSKSTVDLTMPPPRSVVPLNQNRQFRSAPLESPRSSRS